MREQLFDEELTLHCGCNEPRCLVWFGFDNDEKWGPELFIDIESSELRFWPRVKKAARLILFGLFRERADIVLTGFHNIRELRDFCDKCLAAERAAKGEGR